MKICILTAGKGTRMGPVDNNLNKALLPIKNKAIISHIIEFFPEDSEFVVAVGYKAQQVKDYLSAAHPNKKITFVEIENIDGPGSGPGYSLLCCKEELQEPFISLPCDSLFYGDLKSTPKGNWVGTKMVDPDLSVECCNFVVKDGIVMEIKDKQRCDKDFLAWSGLVYVHDYKDFWNSIREPTIIAGEHQISNGLKGLMNGTGLLAVEVNWINLGDADKYHTERQKGIKYDFSKIDEAIYFINKKVIKFFSDSEIIENRIKKVEMKPDIFPKITRNGEQFYSYSFADGEILYEYTTPTVFKNLLQWLDKNVWTNVSVEDEKIKEICYEFYYTKTIKRLNLFKEKNPNYKFPTKINGKKVQPITKLVENIPWDYLCSGVPTFIHGDLQFDNIIYDKESDSFLLIDWRQDFAGEIDFGDIYYDLAKLLGGILLNYDYIKKGLFRYIDHEDGVLIDFARRTSAEEYKKLLGEFIVSKGLDLRKVRLLVGIIYINMAALHHPPFNFVLIALGTSMINEELHMQ